MSITPYLDLITSEHADRPKFVAWLSSALNKVDDGMSVSIGMPSDFDINNAVGPQLDVLGVSVGQPRDIGVPLTNASSILDDDHYRTVLRAKIARNQWNGTTPQIYDIWSTAFPNSELQIIDNQDMTMQAAITGMTDNIDTELVTAGLIIPRPMGVTLSIISTTDIPDSQYLVSVVSSQYIQSITSPAP